MTVGVARPAGEAGIPVLLFHSVAETPPVGQEQHYTVAPRRFGEHIAAIVDSGRTAMTVTELAEALTGRRELPARPVGVTFDDGFDDTLPAVERLLEAGISSTVYVTTGTIETPAGISAAALAALAATGAELGAHSVSHPHLDELRLPEAAREIRESREQLAQRLGREVPSFAYPHGAYERRVREAVIACGFRSAAAVKNALSHRHDDPFAIARWTVVHDTPPQRVA